MRFDGINKSNVRTSIQIDDEYYQLALSAYSFHITRNEAVKRIKEIMKKALFEEKSNKWIKQEIQEEILIYITINQKTGEAK